MRLIDADAHTEKIVRLYDFVLMAAASPAYLFQRVMRALKEAPTIEAEPVRHGHWVTKTRHEHYPSGKEYEEDFCSICGKRGSVEYEYCPHCGAKLDEVSE